MKTEPVEEFCENDAAPVVPECPDCIDKFMHLARRYEAENVKLRAEVETLKRDRAELLGPYSTLQIALVARDGTVARLREVELQVKEYREALQAIERCEPLPINRPQNIAYKVLHREVTDKKEGV